MAFLNRAAYVLGLALIAAATATLAGVQALPTLTGPVTDIANVIDAPSRAELDRRIRSLQSRTGDAVVVVTVPTFAPAASIEEYAVRLFEQAGVGDKAKDTGVLIVVAVNDRAVRIETGYGLEEFISDGFAGDTIRQQMLPAFRSGRYGEGLVAGATRVIHRIADRRGVTLDDIPAEVARERRRRPSAGAIIAFILVLFILNSMRGGSRGSTFRHRRGRRGTWSGWHGGIGGFGGGGFGGGLGGGFGGGFGGGGGGFGGFGGGSSGGGGASGRW